VIYRRASAYVCISRDIEREALLAGIPHKRVHYIPHGVDLERFHPARPGERDAIRASLGWPLDRPVVLFVGRLSTEKGVLDLLEAWRVLFGTDALLVLVGPDMPKHPWNAGPAARAFVEEHELGDRVRFEGPTEDAAPFYRAADLFVQPSHFEAFGISAIEAMASGVPVVAARVGGLRDFVKPGRNGLVHEPRDPMSLASALKEALDSEALRTALATAALATVAKHFNERVVLDRYAAIIQATVKAA
jgi:D-inositol-3-phosphate glycosyltransferase